MPVSSAKTRTAQACSSAEPNHPPSFRTTENVSQTHLPTATELDVSAIGQRSPLHGGGIEARLRKQLAEQICSIQSKAEPRVSKSGRPNVSLNCIVPVVMNGHSEVVFVGTVKCRHFAYEFSKHRGKKSGLMAQFASVQTIRSMFHGRLDQIDLEFTETLCAPKYHRVFLENRQLGRYLAALVHELESKYPQQARLETREVNCLLLTDNHAMALHVQRKFKNGVGYFAAKLYEPDSTSSYMRVENLHPEGLRHLTLSDLLIRKSYKPAAFVAVCLDDRLEPRITECISTPLPQAMSVALLLGMTDAARQLMQVAQSVSPTTFAELFTGFNRSTGHCGLAAALIHNSIELVSLVVDTVLQSGIPPGHKTNLLMAMSHSGDTGLYSTFEKGSTKMVQAFTKRVLASPYIDTKSKVLVLAAWSSTHRRPGLQEAFRTGQTDKVEAFTKSVLASPNLNEDSKFSLLSARAADGTTGLAAACYGRHNQTVHAFAALISQSDLSQARKTELLAPSARDC